MELQTLGYIDRFGVQAVMGRPLFLGEIRAMVMAENLKNAYQDRELSENWAEWTSKHKEEAQVLSALDKLYG